MNRIPIGPIVVSLALVVAGGVYYAVALRDDRPAPRADGTLAMVVWDIGGEPRAFDAETIAGVLRENRANLSALVGLSSSEQADHIVAALGGGWHVAAVSADTANTSYLVLLAKDGLGQVDQHLVDAGCSRTAIVFDISDSQRRLTRIICCDAEGDGPDCVQQYVDDVIAWCEGTPAALTVVTGRLGAARLPVAYAPVHAHDGSRSGGCTVYVAGTADISTRPVGAVDATCPEHEPVLIEIAQ